MENRLEEIRKARGIKQEGSRVGAGRVAPDHQLARSRRGATTLPSCSRSK